MLRHARAASACNGTRFHMPRADNESAHVLDGVAALLALAMHDSYAPVERLGTALERMASAIARCAHAREQGQSLEPSSLAALVACQDALEREIAVCIESLQFHDRLMQRLAHVRDCLAEATGNGHAPGRERRVFDLPAGSIELF